ncbi:hypothetical protein ElyMa_005905800 [Elysia marginata]|uniref:Uncharacterized protein n=1 Tax=Elysia marginata TaxID=1093978 RepID=A0AAV4G5J5_9GAST|nr:hypothetical protein ElyMa_005905800 [Elysia marginata]
MLSTRRLAHINLLPVPARGGYSLFTAADVEGPKGDPRLGLSFWSPWSEVDCFPLLRAGQNKRLICPRTLAGHRDITECLSVSRSSATSARCLLWEIAMTIVHYP